MNILQRTQWKKKLSIKPFILKTLRETITKGFYFPKGVPSSLSYLNPSEDPIEATTKVPTKETNIIASFDPSEIPWNKTSGLTYFNPSDKPEILYPLLKSTQFELNSVFISQWQSFEWYLIRFFRGLPPFSTNLG